MTDLASGHYGAYDPMWLIFGKPNNAYQSNVPFRTNAHLTKLGTMAGGAIAGQEIGCVIAIPVQEGDVLQKATFLVTKTSKEAEAGYFALYAGKKTGKLLGQSKTKKYAATIEAGKPFTFELEKPITITSENAPNGYVYGVLTIEFEVAAGEAPEVVVVPVPKACQAEWFTGCPEVWAGTAGTGLKTTAEATLGAVTSKAVVPLVFLT